MEIDYIGEVKSWIEKFVIGLNLCPFAKAPFKSDSIGYKIASATQKEAFLSAFQQELMLLLDNDVATTIVIIPNKSLGFREYLSLYEACELLIQEHELEEVFQLASFHPMYQFADAGPDEQSNYTNRSPYPLVHILRAAEMTKAIESYGDTAAIYKRNIELLNKLSKDDLNAYLS